MPTSQRTRELRALGELANEDRYIVGNARCLSEGVDVPALDGVAFVDPKRSEIDIVQAVGRAIRLAEGKSFGTIVIPVFISDKDDPDEVLSTSEFDQVWKVVNALRSHDETLGETLDELRVGLGRRSKVTLSGTKIIFDLPTGVDSRFTEAFESRLIETTTSSWAVWYAELADFFAVNGHTNIPRSNESERLARWASKQRSQKASMSQNRRERLEEIDFIWDVLEYEWMESFRHLKEFYSCSPSRKIPKSKRSLASWVDKQRRDKDRLDDDKKALLNEMNFDWNPFETAWQEGFTYLNLYMAINGPKARVSQDLVFEGYQLGTWVAAQRLKKKKNQLDPQKINSLNEIDFVWNQKDADWEFGYECLRKYVQENGSAEVSSKYFCHSCERSDGSPFPLGTWVHFQRTDQAKLNDARVRKLHELGFIFDVFEYRFEQFIRVLQSIATANIDTNVPANFIDSSGNKIGQQLVRYRSNYRQGKLTEDQIKEMERLGIRWNLRPN